jgi:phosphoenolpyruvate phosphomutase
MIIARIESLILEQGLEDSVKRAQGYLEAGADGIMIHSRKKEPTEIFDFCAQYKKFSNGKTLVVVPTSYNQVYEDELAKAGVNIVIYANQLLRSAYPAMLNTAKTILKNKRTKEADESCMSIKEILNIIPGTNE